MKVPAIPEDEQARLETLRSIDVLDTSPEERFDQLTRMAKRLFGVPIALVSIVDEKRYALSIKSREILVRRMLTH